MSKRRHTKLGKLTRGPQGRFLCRYCKLEVTPPRRTFCCDRCVHEYRLRSDSGYASQQVFERDAGICKACGVDTVKRRQDARLEMLEAKRVFMPHDQYMAIFDAWKAAGWPNTTSRNWFDVDHILSVVDGGGECGLDNLQTLCCPCHKRKTAELAARRKRERQEAKKKDIR